ncbi:MAG: hypothetical protein NXI32_03520 [bacterium]|nr:hypothetical protein [bacterium]
MPNEFDDETLVAFLDGELEQQQSQAIEAELDSDPELQQRVATLRQSWDLLSELPSPVPNPDLARSTIELVTLELDTKPKRGWLSWKYRRPLLLVLFAAISVGLGALAGQFLSVAFAGHLRRNLDVIADYAALKEIDSVEWLNELDAINYLTTAFPGDVIGDGNVPERWREREQWMDSLDEIDRGLLQDNAKAFVREPEERKDSLREVMKVIHEQAEETNDLLPQVRAYAALLDSRSGKQKETLKSMPINKRREQVQLIVNFKMRTIFAAQMPEKDRVAIDRWLLSNDFLPNDVNELMFDSSFMPETLMQDLISQLSDEARSILEPQTVEEQSLSLGYWVTSVVFPEQKAAVSAEQLAEVLAQLANDSDYQAADELERIELLPEEQAQRVLRRMAGADDEELDNLQMGGQ